MEVTVGQGTNSKFACCAVYSQTTQQEAEKVQYSTVIESNSGQFPGATHELTQHAC